jgi:hypothetical protein
MQHRIPTDMRDSVFPSPTRMVLVNATTDGHMFGWGEGAPTGATTGFNKAGIYQDIAGGEAYINTGTPGTPVWKQITHAA